jgi:hypothetical protein
MSDAAKQVVLVQYERTMLRREQTMFRREQIMCELCPAAFRPQAGSAV